MQNFFIRMVRSNMAELHLGFVGWQAMLFMEKRGIRLGYMNRLITVQNLSAVTAACMMVPAKGFS